MAIINTNFNPNEGAIVVDINECQYTEFSSAATGVSGDGNFTGKSETNTNISAPNRYLIDQAWETDNLYFIKANNSICKTSFNGIVLASNVSTYSPLSISVNQRRAVPTDVNDYISEDGCTIVDLDVSNNLYIKTFDENLNAINTTQIYTTYSFGSKIHLVPYGSSQYEKFVLLYSKSGDESFWYAEYYDLSISTSSIYRCHDTFSEAYCSGYCFPMEDKTPAFILNNKLWLITSRIDGTTNFTREKVRIFGLDSVSQGLIEKTIDPLDDLGLGDLSRLADMDINYSIPNTILFVGGCENSTWITRYGSSGNLISASTGNSIEMPTAIKCIQSPTSSSFYILTENDSDYFPAICDNSSSSETESSSTENLWTETNPINYFIPISMASSNTNSIIYVGGCTQFPHYGYNARLYKSTDQLNFTDITPYAEMVANAISRTASTWIYEIQCDANGKNILLGLGGVSGRRTAYNDVPSEVLFSNDYGSTWTVAIPILQELNYYVGTNNSLFVSQDGTRLAVYCGGPGALPTDDSVYLNNNSGSGTWTEYNLYLIHNPTCHGGPGGKGVYISETTNEVLCLNSGHDGSDFLINAVYSSNFGLSWEYHGNMTTTEDSWFTAAGLSDDLSQALLCLYQINYPARGTKIWNSSSAISNPPISNFIISGSGEVDYYIPIICNNSCTAAYSITSPHAFGGSDNYPGIGRWVRSGTSWTFSNIFTSTITDPRAISGSRDLSHVCVADQIDLGEGNLQCIIHLR